MGVMFRSCTNPDYKSEGFYSFQILPNIRQIIEIRTISGHLKVRMNEDLSSQNISFRAELGASSEESLANMQITFLQTKEGVVISEMAKTF